MSSAASRELLRAATAINARLRTVRRKPATTIIGGGQMLEVVTNWYCPKCGLTDQTKEARPHAQLHPCPKVAGMLVPFLPQGTKAKIYAVEREDYEGSDKLIQRDENGRPIMSVVTVRDEGQDVVVFAPTATLSAKEL